MTGFLRFLNIDAETFTFYMHQYGGGLYIRNPPVFFFGLHFNRTTIIPLVKQ